MNWKAGGGFDDDEKKMKNMTFQRIHFGTGFNIKIILADSKIRSFQRTELTT